jgi:hypothetical protein
VVKPEGNKITLTGKQVKNNGGSSVSIKQKKEEIKACDQKSDIEGDNT